MAFAYVDAEDDVRRHDYLAAEAKLLRIYSLIPDEMPLGPISLLMSLVWLRLGNLSAAAELALTAIGHVRSLRVYANKTERAYLSYVGKSIYEEARYRSGAPANLDVGVNYDDLDVRRVRSSLRQTFPISGPDLPAGRQTH